MLAQTVERQSGNVVGELMPYEAGKKGLRLLGKKLKAQQTQSNTLPHSEHVTESAIALAVTIQVQ